MDTASFGGFLRTLLIIVLCYYAFKFAMRYLFPLFIYKVAKKAEQNFQQKQQNYREQQNTTQETKNSNHFESGGGMKEKKKVGEYIEFEELD